jgi:precorrin-6A/cobalt-precorrin-6A reductase
MVILLGESVAARELCKQLSSRGLEIVHRQSCTEETWSPIPSMVIDASHPSMSSKFNPFRRWCEQQEVPFLRLERPEIKVPSSPLIFPVHSWDESLIQLEECIHRLRQKNSRPITIFITTGSHQLSSITNSYFASSVRLVVRILPELRLLQKCQEAGIHPRDIIAMQGPFSKDINKALFKFYGADIILTRDSGLAGGTDTKISAALELGLEIVLVRKAKTNSGLIVYSTQEILNWIDKNLPNLKSSETRGML